MNIILVPAVTIFFIFFVTSVIVLLTYLPLWIQVRVSGIELSVFQLIGMRLRRLNPKFVCQQLITLSKAGIDVPVDDLEAHVLAGGNLSAVAEALIASAKAGLGYPFQRIAAIDLAGRDAVDAVSTTVEPKVLVCPPHSAGTIMGVARDGVRLAVSIRVTVRTNFERLVGGAGEETVIARVGEGIIAAIGSADTHKRILERPEVIAEYILSCGLDRGTSFEILSVDVAEIEVIDNIGARLQNVQAESDKRVAQAKAEMRRVSAIATEREMRAKVTEMTSQLTFARSIVPRAVASGYHRGNIWRSPNPVGLGFNRCLWDPLIR